MSAPAPSRFRTTSHSVSVGAFIEQFLDRSDFGRRAIIVLSDGDDTTRPVSFDEVLDLGSRSDTVITRLAVRARDNA